MNESPLRNQSFAFAIRIVKLYQFLSNDKREVVMSKQLLRSGTAVGALVREAQRAESKAYFAHKMAIAHKEADESAYWIELLQATAYLTTEQAQSLLSDCEALIKMLSSTRKTTRNNP